MTGRPTPPRRRRDGFTLIELLGVIAIISILLVFLVPAVTRVIGVGNDTRVVADISAIETALANFQTEFGFYPPSKIVFPQKAATTDWTTSNDTRQALNFLRRMFPSIDVDSNEDVE
ncbi:MAG: prepilin-type N-terminal cleavage/methylation domain-containing protein, partial [Planctomycetota bacterium]